MASVIETPTGLRILAAHLAPIQALAGAQTKDGHGLILSAGGDDTIRSWDATTGEENGFTRSSGGVVSFLSVAPVNDGYVVVCVNRKGVQRWDLATGQSIGNRSGRRIRDRVRPAGPARSRSRPSPVQRFWSAEVLTERYAAGNCSPARRLGRRRPATTGRCSVSGG